MKKTFEVGCYIQDIKIEDDRYLVEIETEDGRDLFFTIKEKDEELHFDNISSHYRLWHKEKVLKNVLSWILYSEQRNYWDKFIPKKIIYIIGKNST